jgi:hypothetical protein
MTGSRRHRVPALVLASFMATSASARAQTAAPATAVLPQTITVGDVFVAAIQLQVPPGTEVSFPDTLAVPAEVEAAGRRRIEVDTVSGQLVHRAIYPLAAWRPDSMALPDAEVRVSTGGREEVLSARFPGFAISSVLPADTAGIEPKPAKDVFGANRLWWPILLALALLAALAALAWWLYRRRRRPVPVVSSEPRISPREEVIAALERARRAGLVEAGRMKEFYSQVSDALRRYMDAIEPRWGADLTTSELAGRMRGLAPDPMTAEVLGILGEADLVKFARLKMTPTDALTRLGAARAWVERWDWPPAEPEAKAA